MSWTKEDEARKQSVQTMLAGLQVSLMTKRYRSPKVRHRIIDEAKALQEKKDKEEGRHKKTLKRPTKRIKIGRNAPCPCGSGKKFKKCCQR